MKNILETLGIKKKNSIDEFVDGVTAAKDKAVKDVKGYAAKVTKPATDAVTEVRESQTYAAVKDKAGELADGVKGAMGVYGPSGVPPEPSLGEKIAYTAQGIGDDIAHALPFKKKNSIDELVDGAKTKTGDAAQDVKDYAGKVTKPVTDFVTEIKESETYAEIKDAGKDQ